MLRIDLKQKFSSVHFEDIITEYWNASFASSNISFDLSKLEWIAIEQITFLLSWINQLADVDKSVTVILPDANGTKKDYKRRQNCLNYLFSDWRFTDLLATNLYETEFKTFVQYIEKEIKANTFLNYFDNHYLHYSLVKELYSNCVQHAYSDTTNKTCLFSLDSNNKIETHSDEVLQSNLEARYKERPGSIIFFR